MKIVALSDTHGLHLNVKNIPDGDVLIHCGDFCSWGNIKDAQKFLHWFNAMPHKHKIFIAGNHDVLFEKNSGVAKALVRECPELIYLEDTGVCIDGVNFWGSPVTPTFFNWAFNRNRGFAIRKHWEAIPDDTDVLISHGPPHKICDTVLRARGFPDEVGCEELAKRVQQLKLKLHLFGHIHFSGGSEKTFGSTIFSNVCLCNEDYRIVNEPKVFII